MPGPEMLGLRSAIIASGLIRAAEAVGGNGAVLAKGDPDSGAIMLVLTTRGVDPIVFERVSSLTTGFTWNKAEIDESAPSQRVARLIDRKKRFDPDIWIVELDIPQVEQFIADTLGAT